MFQIKRLLLLCGLLCCAVSFAWAAEPPPEALLYDEAYRLTAIEDVLQVAVEELGYAETKGGYTKYGDWAGNAYAEWCSEFVSWCVDQADLRRDSFLLGSLYPMQVTCQQGVNWYMERGRYITVSGEMKGYGPQWYLSDGTWVADRPYVPRRGDCLYIEWYKYNRIDHVALVETVMIDETGVYQIYTIEGNNPDSVARFVYPLQDESLRGYGTSQRLVGTTLQKGNRGELVSELQQALVDRGYLREDLVTGNYGERTFSAVQALQQELEMPATGIADRDTQKVLGLW